MRLTALIAGLLAFTLAGCGGIAGRPAIPLSVIELEDARGALALAAGHRIANQPGLPDEVTKPFKPDAKPQRAEASPPPAPTPAPPQPTPVKAMPPAKPRFQASMPPQGTGLRIVLFSAKWCGPCIPAKANFEAFVKGRGLDATEWGIVDIDSQPDKYNVGTVPTIILIDSQGKELNRITGIASLEQIEDLWLSQKRPHNMSGLPLDRTALAVSPEIESILQKLPQLVKSAAFKLGLTQQISIPLPGVGEIVIPQNVSLQAATVAGGFRVAVETGTTAPWVKSKWMGSLYPIPITAVSVIGTKATIELRGWKDLVVSLE